MRDLKIVNARIPDYEKDCLREVDLLIRDGKIEKITGLNIYPVDYFCPMNYYTGEISITENTCSIHHYSATWITDKEKKVKQVQKKLEEKLHISLEHNVLFSVWKNMYCYGIKGFVKKFVALTFRKER